MPTRLCAGLLRVASGYVKKTQGRGLARSMHGPETWMKDGVMAKRNFDIRWTEEQVRKNSYTAVCYGSGSEGVGGLGPLMIGQICGKLLSQIRQCC